MYMNLAGRRRHRGARRHSRPPMRRPLDRRNLMSRDPYFPPHRPDDDEADAAPARDVPEQPGYLTRIPVRSVNRIVIVQVAQIRRLEAEDNYVRIWTDRPYLHKETLTGLMEKLDPTEFLRIHRSHAVNIRVVREL